MSTTLLTEALVVHVGTAQAGPTGVRDLRRGLANFPGKPLPNSLLKHTDDQAVLALDAVRASLTEAGDFAGWGIVAAPRRPGRSIMQPAIPRYHSEGAWSVSPHIVPHCSLHSLSGLLSMALEVHGPNLGAGGVPGSEGEAVVAALTLLAGDQLPGIWILFTGWEPEAGPDAVCRAVALGVTRPGGAGQGRLRWSSALSHQADFDLEALHETIRQQRTTAWSLGHNGSLQLSFEELQ
ncbi:MAG: hypothetical protein AB7K24_10925 [Gemmataceae bacterium]